MSQPGKSPYGRTFFLQIPFKVTGTLRFALTGKGHTRMIKCKRQRLWIKTHIFVCVVGTLTTQEGSLA
jgi:hypothetical protein